jgi:hypothetical protein
MRATVLGLALIVATSAAAFEDVDGSFAKLTQLQRDAVSKSLEPEINDARSARLRQMQAKNPIGICGMIQSRNRAGAYAAYKKFYVFVPGPSVTLESESSDPAEANLAKIRLQSIQEFCRFPD